MNLTDQVITHIVHQIAITNLEQKNSPFESLFHYTIAPKDPLTAHDA
jgi:hypothetical protein